MKIPSNHSLVNIPFLPSSPAPTPRTATIASLISPGADVPVARRESPPARSRPSSPKSRIGTLKKRPMSLHASRPGSWHVDSPLGSSSIKAKKSGKGKRSSTLIEEEGGSSNDVSYSALTSCQLTDRIIRTYRLEIPDVEATGSPESRLFYCHCLSRIAQSNSKDLQASNHLRRRPLGTQYRQCLTRKKLRTRSKAMVHPLKSSEQAGHSGFKMMVVPTCSQWRNQAPDQ